MARNTPGWWNEYFAGPLLTTGTVNIMLVPAGHTFYLWYVSLTIYGPPLQAGSIIYLALDGVPLASITHDRTLADVALAKPIPFSQSMMVGQLGGLDTAKNLLVCWLGEAR